MKNNNTLRPIASLNDSEWEALGVYHTHYKTDLLNGVEKFTTSQYKWLMNNNIDYVINKTNMNFTLKEPIQYVELKAWFIENQDNLPKQLKVPGRNYTNVALIIETNTFRFESQLKASKDNIKIDDLAKSSHRILTTLYNDLKQTT